MYKLDKKELEIINKASEITLTDYNVKNETISFEDLITALDDVISFYENKEEELKELQKDIEENCIRIPVQDQYGV